MAPFVSFSVIATENAGLDDDQLLLTSCQALTMNPEQENAKFCVYFIQGFLAAAQAIDPPITNKKAKESRKFYSLMSRSNRAMYQIPPTRFIPFCIPNDESGVRVIQIVSKQLSSQIDTIQLLRGMIFNVLKAEYPCGKPNQS